MFIYELSSDSFAYFNKHEEAVVRNGQINAVKYIQDLARQTGTNINKWDLLTVFAGTTSGRILTNRRSINREFFKYRDVAGFESSLSPEVIASIKDSFGARITSTKRRLSKMLSEDEHNIKHFYEEISQRRKQLLKTKQTLMLLGGDDPSQVMADSLERALARGFFELVHIDRERNFYFVTKNNINLAYKNDMQSIDLDLDMGKYLVLVSGEDSAARIWPWRENSFYDGRIHPHISSSGSEPCLGSLGPRYSEAIANGDVHDLLMIVELILTNYNHDDPYASLHLFDVDDRHDYHEYPPLGGIAPRPAGVLLGIRDGSIKSPVIDGVNSDSGSMLSRSPLFNDVADGTATDFTPVSQAHDIAVSPTGEWTVSPGSVTGYNGVAPTVDWAGPLPDGSAQSVPEASDADDELRAAARDPRTSSDRLHALRREARDRDLSVRDPSNVSEALVDAAVAINETIAAGEDTSVF